MVALDDDVLRNSFEELQKLYPGVKFRSCGADLSSSDFMGKVIEATKDIKVNLVFNNAGFITTGFFHDVPLERFLDFACPVSL